MVKRYIEENVNKIVIKLFLQAVALLEACYCFILKKNL